MPIMLEDTIWAGSEANYKFVCDAAEAAATRMRAGDWDEDADEEGSRLLQKQDGIGLVSIKGPLVNSGSWWNRLFGVTGYPEIREAMIQAASDPEIKEILMLFDTGGGAVSGVSDAGSLIRMINDQVKPVTAFTDGTMGSAGYWLGSSAGKVFAGRMAVVGSIGVIATHMERSKQLKDAGIGVNVVRSGKFKALANSVEPLTEEGRKQIQAQVDAAAAVFDEHVALMRGRSVDFVREHMGQGREFVSEDAQRVGLIDGVKTFDTLMTELTKSIDLSKNSMDNRGNAGRGYRASTETINNGDHEMGKRALTEQAIAALAAGAVLEAGAVSGVVLEDEAAAGTDAAVVGTEAEAEAQASGAVTADVEVAKTGEGISLLKEQLKAAQDELFEAKIESRKATDKLAEVEAQVSPMATIVAKAINHMQVALGGSALDMSGMTPNALVAEHGRMVDQFQSKFKAGGVAAVDAAQVTKNEQKVDALTQARFNAVRFSK